ncbi:hypothetical protein FEDK69T_30840 [Flavobacterium enshiense DK69]|nr:hypothetical protein FEDK69T_30840 [Flavobacterium enshiense DK69]
MFLSCFFHRIAAKLPLTSPVYEVAKFLILMFTNIPKRLKEKS